MATSRYLIRKTGIRNRESVDRVRKRHTDYSGKRRLAALETEIGNWNWQNFHIGNIIPFPVSEIEVQILKPEVNHESRTTVSQFPFVNFRAAPISRCPSGAGPARCRPPPQGADTPAVYMTAHGCAWKNRMQRSLE